ncbi:MAG: MCP four helix bundle domain-containing protein [Opitutae bacterium]|nr:MCP four helix bundle domain-containing protein [Opitutae bacterium]
MLSRLKFWLMIGLLASNLAVGLLSLYVLRNVNQRYAHLLDRSVPTLNGLRTLSRELSAVQRLARRIVDPDNENAWADLLPQMDESSNLAQVHARDVARVEAFAETPLRGTIERYSREYDEKVDTFLALARARKLEDANRYNTDVLRPFHDSYQNALDDAADHVQQQGRDLRDRYAEDSRFFSSLLLAFAGWPLLAGLAAVFVMAVLIVGLLVSVFAPGLMARNRPTNDQAS